MGRGRYAVGAVAFGSTAALGSAQGGYFPDAWGWASLGLVWVAALALILRPEIEVNRAQWTFLGLLSAVAIWAGLSILWTTSTPVSVLEVERDLIYVAGGLCLILLAGRDSSRPILVGIMAAAVLLGVWSLLAEIFQGRLNPVPTYRLAGPLGYWNTLGCLQAMATVLATALLAIEAKPVRRALLAAPVPALIVTIYLTFGKSAWLAALAGLMAAMALAPRRSVLVATVAMLLPASAAAFVLASRSTALSTPGAPASQALEQGHRLVVAVALLSLVTAILAATGVRDAVASQIRRVPRKAALASLAIVAGCAVVGVASAGPARLASDFRQRFEAPTPALSKPLNGRLLNLSGSGRAALWSVAWRTFKSEPLSGHGAGSFSRSWLLERTTDYEAQDAHSLYLETLSELGFIGLVLLAALFAVPLRSAIRARSDPLAAVAAGALVTYLIHAAVDWDWEMPALTLAALSCAAGLLAMDRPSRPLRQWGRARLGLLAAALTASALSLVVLVGNGAVQSSTAHLAAGDFHSALDSAHVAARWAPWAALAWQLQGEAEEGLKHRGAAQADFERALDRDRGDWSVWLDRAQLERGSRKRQLLMAAARLNPHSPEIFAAAFGEEPLLRRR